MSLRDIACKDAVVLYELLKAGVVTPSQILAVYSARMDVLNPRLNAFLERDQARVAEDARASDGRWKAGRPISFFDGLPVGVKANIAVAGLPWHGGIAAYADRVAAKDADCVAALRQAGAIILGTLNMDEAALGATNDNLAFGRGHNPYRHGFTPGGSSGGAAAAVAAGLCVAALGTDTMGSVRIPASYCGVFGYKPKHGRVPAAGVMPLSRTLDDVGVLARTARDVSALMEILTTRYPVVHDDNDLRQARVGFLDAANFGELDADVADCLARVVGLAGIHVARVALPAWDVVAIRRAALLVVEVEALAVHRAMLLQKPGGFSPRLTQMLSWADRQPESKIAAAYEVLQAAGSMLHAAFRDFDAVLMPATATTAFAFGQVPPEGQADFTLLANVSGLAAMAFPTGLSRAGLPVSVQIIGMDEQMIIHFAGRLAALIAPPTDENS